MKISYKVFGLLIILMITLATGCSSTSPQSHEATSNPGPLPKTPVEASGSGTYYDFPDVQVPAGMELKKDRSIIFTVGSLKAGLLVFKDYVDGESLFNFYLEAMAKDAWTLKSSNKYPTSALFYAKRGKTCVIHILETTFQTELSIWVAPSK
jgi:hypothetical protein